MAYASVSLLTLRTRLQDRYTGDPFWSATEANDAINEALRWYNLFTGFWVGTGTAATSAASPFVTVPTTLTARTTVRRAGKVLTRKSLAEFYRYRRNWRTQTTTTGGEVPTTVREWAPIGLRTIAIWPADNAGGLTLTFEGILATPQLSADGDFLDLGEEELTALLGEALYILSFKRPSAMEGLAGGHQRFLEACLEKNDKLRASAYFRSVLGLVDQQHRLHPSSAPKVTDASR